ncbi:hypothetical protein CkaCkLH20_11052 [Colletotrichum karsti]|uniref:Uncharacterized protein n=1 Tax=Colletotrichum karsti TaxID=1095194 RepID=A0A9P6I3S0_9PEZI|nr:uncharacterized protein CkaCkLH20_11052 [Colletotrichum karsti]KAF9871405.1 hypothetical protein CkaCkLH20_11052 [Colletotrichum karsti]
MEPLGSYPSYMEIAEDQIGAQGGPEFINFVATQTRVKRRGRTIKDDLLEEPQRLLENLNSYLAVRVSLCTGVSQRVPLRALFGDLFPAYASTLSSREAVAIWNELQADHRISDRLINAYKSEGEPSPLREWLLSLSHAQLTFIFSAMEQMLKTLKFTGLSPNGKVFSVACPRDAFSRCFEIPLGEETKWASLLADSQKCATFAYVTTVCLVTDEVSCQCPGSWTNSMPLLETSVLAPTARQWNLSDGSFYFFINLENDMNWVEARQHTDGSNRWNTLITVHQVTGVALSWRVRIMGKSWGNQIRERRDHWETALAVSISSTRNRLRRQLD